MEGRFFGLAAPDRAPLILLAPIAEVTTEKHPRRGAVSYSRATVGAVVL